MPEISTPHPTGNSEAAPRAAGSAARTTRKSSTAASPAKPRATRKKKGPTAAELAALEELRRELAATRTELETARREVAEVVAACRDAESRVSATRMSADAIRRTVAEVDTAATAVRGIADTAQAEVRRIQEQSAQAEERYTRLREWLKETRGEFSALDAEARRTLDNFRAAVEHLREGGTGEPPPGALAAEPVAGVELPEVEPLPPEDRAEDVGKRLIHLLNDAWGTEKEQVGLLQTLADECGDREVRIMLEEYRAACQRRQEGLEVRLQSLGTRPSSGRGLLGQLATRLWDAVQTPRDQADKAVLSLLKALSATEFQAGLYAAAHAYARSAGGIETAEQVAEYFRESRQCADRLRAALTPVVGRTARK